MNKSAFWKMTYGVYIISTWDEGRPTGCVANSAMQITSDPATVAISINHDNYTNECIKKCGKFAISLLQETTDPSIIGTFGYQSGKTVNKFDAIPYTLKEYLPIINDSCAYLVCEVEQTWETSTHTVFLGKVVDADLCSEGKEMTYSYFHNVIKGTSPKNAPTYIAPTE